MHNGFIPAWLEVMSYPPSSALVDEKSLVLPSPEPYSPFPTGWDHPPLPIYLYDITLPRSGSESTLLTRGGIKHFFLYFWDPARSGAGRTNTRRRGNGRMIPSFIPMRVGPPMEYLVKKPYRIYSFYFIARSGFTQKEVAPDPTGSNVAIYLFINLWKPINWSWLDSIHSPLLFCMPLIPPT